MGLYYALEFEQDTLNFLTEKQEELKNVCYDGDWVLPEHFHTTLLYIGNDISDTIPYVKILEQLKSRIPLCAFPIFIQDFNTFPGNIYWVGINDKENQLQFIHDYLKKTLAEENVYFKPDDFPNYVPHITMGYDVKLRELGMTRKFSYPHLSTARFISLFESKKVDDKQLVTKLASVSLY